jgi:hypothetical protein
MPLDGHDLLHVWATYGQELPKVLTDNDPSPTGALSSRQCMGAQPLGPSSMPA